MEFTEMVMFGNPFSDRKKFVGVTPPLCFALVPCPGVSVRSCQADGCAPCFAVDITHLLRLTPAPPVYPDARKRWNFNIFAHLFLKTLL